MALSKTVMDAIRVECKKQHVGEDRIQMLAQAFKIAKENKNSLMTPDLMLRLVGTLEPKSQGKIRQHPVTVYGGQVASVDLVPVIVSGALNSLNGCKMQLRRGSAVVNEMDKIEYYIKEFLYAHPFADGNGRMAWLLRVWVYDQWTAPEELPRYFGES